MTLLRLTSGLRGRGVGTPHDTRGRRPEQVGAKLLPPTHLSHRSGVRGPSPSPRTSRASQRRGDGKGGRSDTNGAVVSDNVPIFAYKHDSIKKKKTVNRDTTIKINRKLFRKYQKLISPFSLPFLGRVAVCLARTLTFIPESRRL